MPPKKIGKQSTKCLKFGEVLLDENRKIIFLCAYCEDFTGIANFLDHLKNCNRVRHIFKTQTSSKLKCDTNETELLKKVKKDSKELLVYGFDNNSADEHDSKNGEVPGILGIEEELLNPKWYTDTTPSDANDKSAASYNELIEEVTPFVQFKENVKTNISAGRVTRVSNKQEGKKDPPTKLFLNDEKKQVLRRAIGETQNTKNVTTKQALMTPTKIVVHDTTSSITQKVTIKRKNLSLPSSKVTNKSDKNYDQITKRRKTLANELQISLESKPMSTSVANVKETNTKTASFAKNTHISTPVVLPIQDKKQEKTILNAKNPIPLRRGRSEIQRPQQEKQVKLQTNPNRLQQSNSPTKGTSNQPLSTDSAIRLQIKQETQALQSVSQSVPIVVEKKITSTHPVQQKAANSFLTNNNQKTAEILNKLQTLGLKVQRTNPQPEPNAKMSSTASNSNEKALEIIKKLQSKGMNVKIIQKPKTTASTKESFVFTTIHSPTPSMEVGSGNTIKSVPSLNSAKQYNSVVNSVLASKTNFGKNVLIKKYN